MKRGRAARDPKNAADLPGRLATCCPLRALVFACRQTHTVNDPVSRQFSSNEHLKTGRNVREIVFIAFRGADKCSIALVPGKGHCSKIASEIDDGDRQTTADAELRRFVKDPLLSYRWLNIQCRVPSKRASAEAGTHDEGIDALVQDSAQSRAPDSWRSAWACHLAAAAARDRRKRAGRVVSSHRPRRCGNRPHRRLPKAVPKIFRRQIACLPLSERSLGLRQLACRRQQVQVLGITSVSLDDIVLFKINSLARWWTCYVSEILPAGGEVHRQGSPRNASGQMGGPDDSSKTSRLALTKIIRRLPPSRRGTSCQLTSPSHRR